MKSLILVTTCCWLNLAYLTSAQDYYDSPTQTSLTPEMSASAAAAAASASSAFSAMFTEPVQDPGTPTGDDAGSSGPSSGGVTISRGGIIAIGVAVGFVVVFGGLSRTNTPPSLYLIILSRFVRTVLPGKEEILGGPSQHPQVRQARRNSFDTTPHRIPQERAKSEEKLKRHVED
jgi:hypothetical protein